MPCPNCPVKCGKMCVSEIFNAKNLCDKVNPEHADFKEAYRVIIADKSCGTTVYQDSLPKKPEHKPPPLIEQIKNFAGAAKEHALAGFKKVDEEEYSRRLAICASCEWFDKEKTRCNHCGCFLKEKAYWSTAKCPIGKWEKPAEKQEEASSPNHVVMVNQTPCKPCGH